MQYRTVEMVRPYFEQADVEQVDQNFDGPQDDRRQRASVQVIRRVIAEKVSRVRDGEITITILAIYEEGAGTVTRPSRQPTEPRKMRVDGMWFM